MCKLKISYEEQKEPQNKIKLSSKGSWPYISLLFRTFHLPLPLPDEGECEETVEDSPLLWTVPTWGVFRYDRHTFMVAWRYISNRPLDLTSLTCVWCCRTDWSNSASLGVTTKPKSHPLRAPVPSVRSVKSSSTESTSASSDSSQRDSSCKRPNLGEHSCHFSTLTVKDD